MYHSNLPWPGRDPVLLSPAFPHLQASKSLHVCHLPGHHSRGEGRCWPLMHPDYGLVAGNALQATVLVTVLVFSIFRSQDGKGFSNLCWWAVTSRPETHIYGLHAKARSWEGNELATALGQRKGQTRSSHVLAILTTKKLLNQWVNVAAMKTKPRS